MTYITYVSQLDNDGDVTLIFDVRKKFDVWLLTFSHTSKILADVPITAYIQKIQLDDSILILKLLPYPNNGFGKLIVIQVFVDVGYKIPKCNTLFALYLSVFILCEPQNAKNRFANFIIEEIATN